MGQWKLHFVALSLLIALLLSTGCQQQSTGSSVAAAPGAVRLEVPYERATEVASDTQGTPLRRVRERLRSGGGVFVNGRRIVTASHVLFSEYKPSERDIPYGVRVINAADPVFLIDESQSRGHSIRTLPRLDIATIAGIDPPSGVRPATISRQSPDVGSQVLVHGFDDARLLRRQGHVVSRSGDGEWFAVDVVAREGDSGSGVYNEQGELVGIIIGHGPKQRPWHVEVKLERAYPFVMVHRTQGSFEPLGATTLVLDVTHLRSRLLTDIASR